MNIFLVNRFAEKRTYIPSSDYNLPSLAVKEEDDRGLPSLNQPLPKLNQGKMMPWKGVSGDNHRYETVFLECRRTNHRNQTVLFLFQNTNTQMFEGQFQI